MDDGDPVVLIVEDNPEIAGIYADDLSEEYRVQIAYTGGQAIEELDETVDVVLLDRRLTEGSGDVVLDEIRERGLDCRVVVVTAVDPDFDLVDMPCDDYLVKPITKHELRAALDRVLGWTARGETLRRYFVLAAKKALLEEYKRREEIEASEAFDELVSRLEAARKRADAALSKLDPEEQEVLSRDPSDP